MITQHLTDWLSYHRARRYASAWFRRRDIADFAEHAAAEIEAAAILPEGHEGCAGIYCVSCVRQSALLGAAAMLRRSGGAR